MSTIEADLAILMPKISDYNRFSIRYAGLSAELGSLGVAPVVRDLTMPKEADKPVYRSGAYLVHHPQTNHYLADKSNLYYAAPDIHPTTAIVTHATVTDGLDIIPGERVVVKPVRGMVSKDVQVLPKLEAARAVLPVGRYLVQEFIDTSAGIPQLGIEGVHNLRGVSIGGLIIGGIARVKGSGGEILRDDVYGGYVSPDELPESMRVITDTVHGVMAGLPGSNQNVLAIDLMCGINASGERVGVLCETNRRPMRISHWDIVEGGNLDNEAIATLATRWDEAEAAMLAEMVA